MFFIVFSAGLWQNKNIPVLATVDYTLCSVHVRKHSQNNLINKMNKAHSLHVFLFGKFRFFFEGNILQGKILVNKIKKLLASLYCTYLYISLLFLKYFFHAFAL
jgi:hypothetical protein